MDLQQTHTRFRTTSWTKIRALGGGSDRDREQALEALTLRYWPAVYAYLRGDGLDQHEAAEITQDFFSTVIIGRELFGIADRGRGRLRNLILRALKNFRCDRSRRGKARGANRTISLEQIEGEEGRLAGSITEDVDTLFERRWALGLVEETLRRCEEHFRRGNMMGHWTVFLRRRLRPALSGVEAPPLADIHAEAGFSTEQQASSAEKEVRRRLKILRSEVVNETLDDPAELDDEIRRLREVLFGTGAALM